MERGHDSEYTNRGREIFLGSSDQEGAFLDLEMHFQTPKIALDLQKVF